MYEFGFGMSIDSDVTMHLYTLQFVISIKVGKDFLCLPWLCEVCSIVVALGSLGLGPM